MGIVGSAAAAVRWTANPRASGSGRGVTRAPGADEAPSAVSGRRLGTARAGARVLGAHGAWTPTVVDLTFGIWAFAISFGMARGLVNSDGDLFWHLRLGDEMLRTGGLVRTDFLSFTRAGEPMVAYEWGSEVLFAGVHRLAGFPGIVVLAALSIAAALALLVRFLVRRRVDPLLAFLTVSAGAILTSFHWLARPHLLSLVGVALLLPLLEPAGRRRAWLAAPLFAVWANLHPGFVFGLGLVGAYLAGDALELWSGADRGAWLERLRYHAALLGIGLLATLANPDGLKLLSHVLWLALGGGTYLRDHTAEFHSPDFHNPAQQLFLAALLVMVAVLALARRRPALPRLLTLLAVTTLALTARRNIPLWGMVALPLVALGANADWRALRAGALRRARKAFLEPHRRGAGGRWAPLAGLALLVLLVLGTAAGRPVVPGALDPTVFPVAAVQHARTAGLQGRLFGDFIWNGYLDLAWPEQRVFIDGHTDFYGEDLMRAYGQVTALEPGWRDTLQKWNISLALLRPDSRLAAELAQEPGWTTWYSDKTAVLLRRTNGAAPGR